jgi:hypothetical protein
MATEVAANSGIRTVQAILLKTEMKSYNNMKQRAFISAGVPGGSKMSVGDLCWDTTNSDAYICTVAATTVVKINA